MKKNSNNHLSSGLLVLILGRLVAYPVAEKIPVSSWHAGGVWLLIVLLLMIGFVVLLPLSVCGIMQSSINIALSNLSNCLCTLVVCQCSVMCPSVECTSSVPAFLFSPAAQDKTKIVQIYFDHVAGIKSCNMPPFDSDAFIIDVDNHASRCNGSNINHFTNVR